MSTEWNRLHDLFQEESKSLQRWFYSLVVMLIFIVFVLWPYIRTVQSLDLIEQDIENITERIKKAMAAVNQVSHGIERASLLIGDASGYQELYRNTESWVSSLDEVNFLSDQKTRQLTSLRATLNPEENAQWPEGSKPGSDIIRILIRESPEQVKKIQSASSCFWKQEEHWIRCEIAAARSKIDKQLSRLLYDRTQSHELTAKLRKKINQNRERFLNGLDNAISHGQLPGWTREYLDREQREIRQWFEEGAEQRLQLISKQKEQKKQLRPMEEKKAELNKRKEEISAFRKLETPFGELPVGFDVLLALLPALMLISGIALLLSQKKLLRFRHGMHELNERFESVPKQAKHWQLILAMWLDPLNGRLNNAGAALLFMAPALIAIISIFALYELPSEVNENGGIDSSTMSLMIVVLLATYLWAYIRLLMTFNAYADFLRYKET